MFVNYVRNIIRGLVGKPAAPPQFDIDEWSRREGWVCLDEPQGRRGRVRFRFDPGGVQIPRAVPPMLPITGGAFIAGGGGGVEHHTGPSKATARPV